MTVNPDKLSQIHQNLIHLPLPMQSYGWLVCCQNLQKFDLICTLLCISLELRKYMSEYITKTFRSYWVYVMDWGIQMGDYNIPNWSVLTLWGKFMVLWLKMKYFIRCFCTGQTVPAGVPGLSLLYWTPSGRSAYYSTSCGASICRC